MKNKKIKCCPEFATQDLHIKASSSLFIKSNMGEGGYKIRDIEGIHFVTFALVEWETCARAKQFTNQKLEYIHNNPAEAGIVEKAEAYLYSCTKDYYNGKNFGVVKIGFALGCKLNKS